MRFLFITTDFPYPGDETRGVFNLHLARELAEEHEVCVIAPRTCQEQIKACRAPKTDCTSDDQKELARLSIHYPTYYHTPKVLRCAYGYFLWHSIKGTIARLLSSYSPDAVISFWAYPDGQVAVRLAGMLGIPGIVIIGGSDVLVLGTNARRRKKLASVFRNAHAVVAVSQDLKDHIVDWGIRPEKVHVWHRGVDGQRFSPGDRMQARARLGIPEGPGLLWVGRMVPVKGLDLLLEACNALRKRVSRFSLFLIGDGPLRRKLQADVVAKGLSDCVRFVGTVPNDQLADWYRAADVTVLASHSEGIPNVLRESLACGTPFVSTRVGGVPELANGHPHRLVRRDAADLAAAIQEMLTLNKPLGQTQNQLPSWKESAKAFVNIVRPLVAATQNPDRPWWIRQSSPAEIAQSVSPAAKPWRQFVRNNIATMLLPRSYSTHGRLDGRSVYLTFDDGPHPIHTPELLYVLKRHDIKATFFVIGRLAERYPELVRRIHEDGHLLGNHSYYHPDPYRPPASLLLSGIARTDRILNEITGCRGFLYRPPHGRMTTWKLLRLWCARKKIALWNIDPKDYACQSAAELLTWFQERPLGAGDVVLLHDRLPYASAVIPYLTTSARERGLTFATIDQCLN
jgi:glycosyltransferase involved in cell wall biosynthesis